MASLDERLRTLLDEIWQGLSEKQQELDVLAEQARAQLERENERFELLKPKLALLDQTLDRYSREELRQLFQAAKEREIRVETLRIELDGLQYKRAILAQEARALARFSTLLVHDEPPPVEAPATPPAADADGGDFGALLLTQETERERLALDLHDNVAQPLHNLVLQTEVLPRALRTHLDQAMAELENVRDTATRVLRDVRRVIFELRPMSLTDLGLLPTLDQYVQLRAERDGIAIRVRAEGRARTLAPAVEIAVFRIVEAALDNVRDHAKVADAEITLVFGERELTVTVADTGRGCNLRLAQASNTGTGLLGMRERARHVGGNLEFDTAPGRGTTVRLTVPLASSLPRAGGVRRATR